MTNGKLLVAAALAWLLAAAGLVWMMQVGGINARYLPSLLGPITGLCAVLAALAGLISLGGAGLGQRTLCWAAAAGAVSWAVIGALFNLMNMLRASAAVGGASLRVMSPGYAENLMLLLIGLSGPLIAFAILKLRGR